MSGRAALSLTPVQMAEVETLAAVLNAEQIADYFGIGRTTFFAIIRRDAEIAARYKKGKARAIGSIAQTLIQKARGGDTASMIFYLKTQGGWRETVAVEQLAEPEPRTLDLSGLSDNTVRELVSAMRAGVERDGPIEGDLLIPIPQSDKTMDRVPTLPAGAQVR